MKSEEPVLRELDSYRTAISDAFEEGFSMGRLDAGFARAWERSEARQTEAMFTYTRMSVAAVVHAIGPPASTNAVREETDTPVVTLREKASS